MRMMVRTLFYAVMIALHATSLSANELELRALPLIRTLDRPVGLAHAGDGSGRLFVVEQRGTIRVAKDHVVVSEPFLDVRNLVLCCGERGLLGLAFHPDFERNGYVFINYTDLAGDTVVARYRIAADDPDRLDPNSASIILRVAQPFSNHNGGHLAFGPDRFLYIGLGDGGSAGDPADRAQNRGELLGKMLRIDVDGAAPYAVPPSNPFVDVAGARGEIWALGLRNPWRYSFDRDTGDLWIADVGQGTWEEVNFQPFSSGGGENYGWRRMEGAHCFNPPAGCDDGTLTKPVAEYSHAEGCSVTGGYVYRGRRYPALRGTYVYGDLCSGKIFGVTRSATGEFASRLLLQTNFTISSFGEDESGELLVVDYSGAVHALIDASERRARPVRRGGS